MSRSGRHILVKAVLEAILVYWMSLSWIPKGILEKDLHICLHFLWSGNKEVSVTPWVRWDRIARPKSLGGWGLKNIFFLAKALVAKGGWRMIQAEYLWTRVMYEKYIAPDSILDWIRNPNKSHQGGFVIWKVVTKSFDVIGENLVWKVGNGRRVRVGEDPWLGCNEGFRLSELLVVSLRQRGVNYLYQLASLVQENRWT